jgi:hypothetical protein
MYKTCQRLLAATCHSALFSILTDSLSTIYNGLSGRLLIGSVTLVLARFDKSP